MHLGHAYAALFAWQAAEKHGGKFLVRLEDIDITRCRPEYETRIFEDLRWLGLSWEEPVWRQASRLSDYRQALDLLSKMGLLYPCFCTRQDMAVLSAPQGPDGPMYPGTCRSLTESERGQRVATGKPYALRLDVAAATRQAGRLTWTDLGRGIIPANPEIFGDVVLARKDITTSYHLAVTVDDAAQEVTLVTRGEDLLASTHIHRLLQELLGLPVPVWHHHRLICDETGRRLAKRDHDRSLCSLREAGATPADIWRMVGLAPN